VLVVDCQATAAAPRGHLLEIGWARVLGTRITHAHASLIALPDGEQMPAQMTARSAPVTTGCAQRILNCRASTSRTTRSCCGLAHACGEKVDETATLMKMMPTKRAVV